MSAAHQRRRTVARRGFTLIELVVVIAIIGILIAILLPAVQAAREASRRTSCQNNLKQIGLALGNYENAHNTLPPGAFWSDTGDKKGSIFVRLLPYLEQPSLYDEVNFNLSNVDNSTFSDALTPIGSTVISTLNCPSDSRATHVNGLATHNYAASRGPTAVYDNPICSCNHAWQAYEMAPLDNPRKFAGPFTRVGTSTRLAQVKDGLSNTIFFGEVRPGCSEHASNGWLTSNNGNGYCTTIIPINYDSCDVNAVDPCNRPCNWNTEVGFKSAHSGGVYFLFGDGAVHFVTESIDHQTYQYLGGKSDGEHATPSI